MRNLKKFLALALAMVMTFSLMLGASAADVKYSDYKDSEDVSSQFVEAVSVLTGLKVVQGDGEEGNIKFRPKDNITRAEAAAMVYRVATGDINGTQERLYSDYGKFADVNKDDWFAGYVGYCQNAGIIKGTTPTTFNPYGKVTGYEVLAMILRAVGYGKNNEFTGSSWQVTVASMGKTKHITDSVVSNDFNYTLNMPATREIVAELLFRGSMIPQVTWTAIGGYNERTTLLGTEGWNSTLMTEVFGLYDDGWKQDTWGRPQFVWKADKNPSTDRTVATLKANYTEAFHDEKRECDVAELMEFGTAASQDYILYVNGKTAVTDKYHIVATDTVTRVGGYGRQVEIYTQEDMDKQFPWHNTWNYYNNAHDEVTRVAPADTIVMIDTYLAKVVNKTEPVLDPAGHVITPARLIVDLYDKNGTVPFDKADSAKNPNRRTISKGATSKASWDFAIGDVISLNGLSSNTAVGTSRNEQWAYTLPQVAVPSSSILTENSQVFNLTKLDGVQAKQTTVYWNNGKHQVGGEDKTDALALRMDKAGTNIDTTFTWYYDQFGYLLGIDDGGKVNYGVITSIYASYGADTNTDGIAKAVATVKYADGTTGTETIDYFMVNGSAPATRNSAKTDTVIEAMDEATDTTVQLWPVYNTGALMPMRETALTFGSTNLAAPQPVRGQAGNQGFVYMAPVAASNSQAAAAGTDGTNPVNVHGILNDNLFKFVKSAGDKTVAIEVAGGETDGIIDAGTFLHASQNVGNDYAGHWAVKSSTTSATAGKLYKSLAYIAREAGTTAAANANVVAWLDNDTKIMVRNEVTGSIAVYDGVDALPGDITISTNNNGGVDTNRHGRFNEIDWADTDGDGRAEVVYLTGTVEGVTAYGLFYTNDLSAQWNGTTATVDGFLNGQRKTLTFTSLAEFNKIKNNSYDGHLYGVRLVGDVVANVLVTDWSGTADTVKLLDTTQGSPLTVFGNDSAASSGNGISVNGAGANGADEDFKYGDTTDPNYVGTNPYTARTEAVYFEDYAASGANRWTVVYNPSYNWQQLGADVVATHYDAAGTADDTRRFHLTPNTKIYGLGSGVVLAEGATALEYLNHSSQINNDVTIVYENSGAANNAVMSVLELYIQTDPNYTPGSTVTAAEPVAGPNLILGPTSAGASTDLLTMIKGLKNTAIYTKNGAYPDGWLVQDQGNGGVLWFPYGQGFTAGTAVNFVIHNSAGTVVYSENLSTTGTAVNTQFAYVSTTGSNAGYQAAGAFSAGTYTFTITGTASGVIYSTGTYTIS